MPARYKDYNLVDDSCDPRIPLHNEEAFQHGINFKAKYIGSLDVAKPKTRTEIIVAMRNIRYEFKAKQVKKRKVFVSVSVDGVKVELRIRKKRKNQWVWDEEHALLMHDPIYRIFYVSHDSHDLNIWSYISRDGNSSQFRCNVFKSRRKRQAMHIVRTVGQAFQVCHNYKPPTSNQAKAEEKRPVLPSSAQGDSTIEETDIDAVDPRFDESTNSSRQGVTNLDVISEKASEPANPLSSSQPDSLEHQMQLMQQQVAHSRHQAQIATDQVKLLKDQLATESAARVQSQAANHRLLLQNQLLLNQIKKLVDQLKMLETGNTSASASPHFAGSVAITSQTPVSASVYTDPIQMEISMGVESPNNVKILSSLMSGDSWFENSEVLAKHDSARSPYSDVTASFLSTSVVQNDHLNGVSPEASQPGCSHMTGSSSSASSSISSSSSIEQFHAPPKANDLSQTFNVTAETSVWTSGLASPDGSAICEAVEKPSVRRSNHTNGYSVSPIPMSLENRSTKKQILSGSSPIKWRSTSQRLPDSGIPRIAPPPRISRVQPGDGAKESGDPLKLFDHDPLNDPIRMSQSSFKPQIMCGSADLLMFNDPQDDTVGSILDAASTSDLKDDDFLTPTSIHSDTHISSDDITGRDAKQSLTLQSAVSQGVAISHI